MAHVRLVCSRTSGTLILGYPSFPHRQPTPQLHWHLWPRLLLSFSHETDHPGEGTKVARKVVKGLSTGFSGTGFCPPWLVMGVCLCEIQLVGVRGPGR